MKNILWILKRVQDDIGIRLRLFCVQSNTELIMHKKNNNFNVLFKFFLCIFLFSSPLFAYEEISSFISEIEIHQNGSMTVSETINVKLDPYKRGIFRDFPTQYKDKFSNSYNVKFDVLNVTKDGEYVLYDLSKYQNGYRLKIGDPKKFLKAGNYTYQIKYKTERQLGFFEDHDELYWNVTGNGWTFFIKSVYAKVILPENVPIKEIVAYTGLYGESLQDYISYSGHPACPEQGRRERGQRVEGNVAEFETAGILRPREGLTIAVAWPKGFIKEPTLLQRISWFFQDNFSTLLLILFILLILAFYLFVWRKFCAVRYSPFDFAPGYAKASPDEQDRFSDGRKDPRHGTIIPLFEPPVLNNEHLLPADIRFILKQKFDNRCFASGIVDMAVKGYLVIEKENNQYCLKKKDKNPTQDVYQKVAQYIFKKDELKISNVNLDRFLSGISALKKYLKENFEGKLFNYNRGYFIAGLFLSFLFIVPIFVLYALIPINIFLIFLIILINILFFNILPSYTEIGKRIEEQILGFKMFLSFTEKERLKYTVILDRTPEEYETFLPYAIALEIGRAHV